MKKLSNLLICFSCILFFGACSDDDEKNPLQGTKWKLEGYSIDGSDLKTMQPSDCEKCYVISFLTNNTWEGQGYVNFIGGKFKQNNEKMEIEVALSSFADIELDERLYLDLLKKTTQYSSTKNKLYLYSEDKTSFLLFKSIAP